MNFCKPIFQILSVSKWIILLASDKVPLGDQVFHGEVHGLVVLCQKLKLFNINFLEQVIDVNSLNSCGNLFLQQFVLLLSTLVVLNQVVILLGQHGMLLR